MTVPVQTPFNEYLGTGAATVFAYTFRIDDEDELAVYINGAVQSAGFTVSGIGNSTGGAVTFSTAPASGAEVLIRREMLFSRQIDYQNSGDFLAGTVNSDIDRIWLAIQQLQRDVDYRALQFPKTLSRTTLQNVLPEPDTSNVLAWDNTGTLVNTPLTITTLSGDKVYVANYTLLRALTGSSLVDGAGVTVTGDGIAGDGVLRNVTAHGLTDNGGTIIVINTNWYWQRIFSGDVMVRWFDLVADQVTDDAVNFNKAANYAATQRKWLDLQDATILHSGAYSVTGAGKYVLWKNGNLKLGPGAKTSGMFVIDDVDAVCMENILINGDRYNVSGNNAGFWVVSNVKLARFWDITMKDLRRYGINCYLNCDIVDLKNITGEDIGISGTALGEAIKIEDSGNITVENFVCTNPSGTGGGQVAKVFHCKNVTLSNFDITDPDPAKVYPGISMVRNENLVYRNIRIVGDTQVAIEDNANFSVIYQNITTEGTDKALIVGTDGAGRGERRAKKIVINNWEDTSTQALAFNILGVLDLTINDLTTPQTLNISRDDPATNRRTENLEMNNVSCNILNTLLVNGRKTLTRVNVTGLWTNSGPGVTDFIKSSYGTYSNGGLTDVFLARWNYEDSTINIFGTMTASGGTFLYRAPDTINNSPFHGEVLGSCLYAPALNTQWSQIRWTFYDAGTPTVNKAVIHSGATPRTNVNLTVAAGTRLLTFTNTEAVDIMITAAVRLINRNDLTVT